MKIPNENAGDLVFYNYNYFVTEQLFADTISEHLDLWKGLGCSKYDGEYLRLGF